MPISERAAPRLLHLSLVLLAIGAATALVAYAYLGTFSRHVADDYCSSQMIDGNFLQNLWLHYQTVSDRFSNFMLIALSEAISPVSVRVLPGLLITLWAAGLGLAFTEIARSGRLAGPSLLPWTMALLLVFFVFLEAPNRYQTLYWRASSAAHLAPLVLLSFLAAGLVRGARKASAGTLAWWAYPLVFAVTFFIGDFSEPTDAVAIVLLALGLVAIWLVMRGEARSRAAMLIGCALAGALVALAAMALSPANALRLHTAPPPIPVVLARSFQYGAEFAVNMLRVLPLPSALAFLIPFLVFFALGPATDAPTSPPPRFLIWTLAAVPVLAWVLIAASFAPSVFGQGFPLERTRLAGLSFLVLALMLCGALVGALLPSAPWNVRRRVTGFAAAAILVLLAIYPVRAAAQILAEVPAYAGRAAAWDQRQAFIFELKARGERNLVIPQFDGLEGIKELDVNASHWTNQCAAHYYGVETIRAIPPDDS